MVQQVEYLLAIALQDDERGKKADASKMYSCAIELAIQAVSETNNCILSCVCWDHVCIRAGGIPAIDMLVVQIISCLVPYIRSSCYQLIVVM